MLFVSFLISLADNMLHIKPGPIMISEILQERENKCELYDQRHFDTTGSRRNVTSRHLIYNP